MSFHWSYVYMRVVVIMSCKRLMCTELCSFLYISYELKLHQLLWYQLAIDDRGNSTEVWLISKRKQASTCSAPLCKYRDFPEAMQSPCLKFVLLTDMVRCWSSVFCSRKSSIIFYCIESAMVMTRLTRDSVFPKQSKLLLTAVITDVAKSSASLQ